MQYRLALTRKQDAFFELITLLSRVGNLRIAKAILYLFYYYMEVLKMSEMVEFIIKVKDYFVPNFGRNDTVIVNNDTNGKTLNDERVLEMLKDNESTATDKIVGNFEFVNMNDGAVKYNFKKDETI